MSEDAKAMPLPLHKHRKCQCHTCKLMDEIDAAFPPPGRTPEQEVALNSLGAGYLNYQLDSNYYDAIFDGSWPNAIEILEAAVARIKTKAGEQYGTK